MPIRNAMHGLALGVVSTISCAAGALRTGQQPPCPVDSGLTLHGELTKPLLGAGAYSFDEFRRFAEGRIWLAANGVTDAPRRADCGGRCIYKGQQNERDDDPPDRVFVSNDPVCDADRVGISTLPRLGVLIGRLTYGRDAGPGGPKHGDAMFNVGTGEFGGGRTRRLREHYVVVSPGQRLIDRTNFAMWRIVALVPPGGPNPTGAVFVVDSGLFRVCLPRHPRPTTVLASFRSCAEVSELHALSYRLAVQRAVLAADVTDTIEAQPRTFALLVRADPAALTRLRSVPDTALFGRPGDGEPDDHAGMTHDDAPATGPFAAATYASRRSIVRRLLDLRYGELQPDAPMWYVCVDGCCAGHPW